jgi:hypothetical protein
MRQIETPYLSPYGYPNNFFWWTKKLYDEKRKKRLSREEKKKYLTKMYQFLSAQQADRGFATSRRGWYYFSMYILYTVWIGTSKKGGGKEYAGGILILRKPRYILV